jgi:hypothetical protein
VRTCCRPAGTGLHTEQRERGGAGAASGQGTGRRQRAVQQSEGEQRKSIRRTDVGVWVEVGDEPLLAADEGALHLVGVVQRGVGVKLRPNLLGLQTPRVAPR